MPEELWTEVYNIVQEAVIKIISKKVVLATQLYPVLHDPMDCSSPGSSVHGIFQARILEWVAISFSRGSFQAGDWTHVSRISCIGRQVIYHWCHLERPYLQGKESKKSKMVVWGDLTNSREKKRNEKEKRKHISISMQSSSEEQEEIRKPS